MFIAIDILTFGTTGMTQMMQTPLPDNPEVQLKGKCGLPTPTSHVYAYQTDLIGFTLLKTQALPLDPAIDSLQCTPRDATPKHHKECYD